ASTGGRLQGGSLLGTTVVGWLPLETRAFEVAGWSADLGHDWNPGWLVSRPDYGFGLSAIGTGFPGGMDLVTGMTLPTLHVFGAEPSITTGFLIVVPEPGVGLFAGAALISVLVFKRAYPRTQ